MKKESSRRIFFTSDLWLGRNNIIDIYDRPFSSVSEMDEIIIEKWNTTVGDNDIVFVLGNLVYDATKIQNILSDLKGIKILMLSETDKLVLRSDYSYVEDLTRINDIFEIEEFTGENHNAIYKDFQLLTSEEIADSIMHIVEFYEPDVMILKNSIIDIARYGIVLSLYPLSEWNGKEVGSINLHGGTLPSSNDMDKDARFSVRSDFWDFKPIELSEIYTLVEQLKTK